MHLRYSQNVTCRHSLSSSFSVHPFQSTHSFATTSPPSTAAPSRPPSINIKQLIVDTAKHYWNGTKQLYHNIKASRQLKQRLSSGEKLTRKEQRFIWQTNQDIKSAVPFLIIAAAPLVGYLLPILVSIFPGMLPSTFKQESNKEKERKQILEQRKQSSEHLAQLLKRTIASHPQLVDVMKRVKLLQTSPSCSEI